ncbi:aminoglycoside phosphotransferase family protein [Kitasatospora sp. NPDC101235]|uniref:aminoglycoside phosphotransferase family protein n=1 Tax=Kitasatospora sp. NPDC101235 TaxID=3364101 RepID=UPI0037F6F454
MSGAEPTITVPTWLTNSVTTTHGEAGRQWLATLPARATAHLAAWNLTLERILDPGGSLSLIAYVHRDDLSPAVLKVGLPTPETAHEHAALTHWAGRGAVLLLDAVPAEGVLLLERLHGEIPLRSLAEPKAMLEATSLLHRLWTELPEGHPFPTVPQRVAAATATAAALAAPRPDRHPAHHTAIAEAQPLIAEALDTARTLADSADESFLLHGDFHHGNVLAADRAPWLAIDPRPLAGERAYDLARLALDRADTLIGAPGAPAAVRRRLGRLSEALEVDQDRLRGWTLFRAVDLALRALTADRREDAELYLEFANSL